MSFVLKANSLRSNFVYFLRGTLAVALIFCSGCSSGGPVSSGNGSGSVGTTNIGTWTWMGGGSTADSPGTYGMLGVPAAGSVPAGRWLAVSWTDRNGNFWLFGGQNEQNLSFNDLWEYSPTSNLWAWISGSSTPGSTGTYGIKGIPSTGNAPPARYGGVSWTDASGKLWLFGGTNNTPNSFYNDLWMFDTTSNLWTWISGSNYTFAAGQYGTQGVASANNVPGARNGAVGWSDSTGNLWLFGGEGYTASSLAGLNDLWKFNTTTLQWTWISGSSLGNQPGVYGIEGSASAGDGPGSRDSSSSWVEGGSKLWLFGGKGDYLSDPILNDLWTFDPTTDEWAWVSGSTTGNVINTYGAQGTPSASAVPASRSEAVSWTDSKGNLWLFGGAEVWSSVASSAQSLGNDLWCFSTASDQWTWMGGGTTGNGNPATGTYGTLGTPSQKNIPGGRGHAVSWVDNAGNLWLFGGIGPDSSGSGGVLNDLWRYSP